jgi:hypothetical protein
MRTLALLVALSMPLTALAERASPHEKVTATVNGHKVTIEYGRPSKKGREIFGGLVPWDKVWRTGADEATVLTTDGPLTIGNIKLQKGSYAIFTIPGQREWKLIVNKNPKQWGAFSYDPKEDVGTTPMVATGTGAAVEQFTIALEPQGKKAVLKMSWDKTAAAVNLE